MAVNESRRTGTGILSRILCVVGVALILLGLCPVAFAIGVDSNVADDPEIVEDGAQLVREWYAWAFSPHYVASLLIGLVSALSGLMLSQPSRRLQILRRSGILVFVAAFAAACSSGWLLF